MRTALSEFFHKWFSYFGPSARKAAVGDKIGREDRAFLFKPLRVIQSARETNVR